ncbi:hypothetical protein FA15DRAFT_92240 [Coprinopsis marcescibilis]|uniref:Uncharacterized protein n=1 Tax=Coprinopsis marcescibilis TaxID=230819 RepID=A0A5C3KLM0_COPMA|nr:hypothetical protein FA15DRAFT_92240 [Coprinopsis marcescibilis]
MMEREVPGLKDTKNGKKHSLAPRPPARDLAADFLEQRKRRKEAARKEKERQDKEKRPVENHVDDEDSNSSDGDPEDRHSPQRQGSQLLRPALKKRAPEVTEDDADPRGKKKQKPAQTRNRIIKTTKKIQMMPVMVKKSMETRRQSTQGRRTNTTRSFPRWLPTRWTMR